VKHASDDAAIGPWVDNFEFVINGRRMSVVGAPPTTTLLEFLRQQGLTGAKHGCDEGECGACTVALLDCDAARRPVYRAINSCLTLLPMLAGREIVTVEGLAKGDLLHPVQAAMVEHYGSQCGYCTPGIVMSLFETFHCDHRSLPHHLGDQLCGNLCRCTGYRAIRDAAAQACGPGRSGADSLAQPAPPPAAAVPLLALAYEGPAATGLAAPQRHHFFRPSSLPTLRQLLRQFPEARLVAGATEIAVELNKKGRAFPCLVSTEAIPELTRIVATPEAWRIGAAATLTAIEDTVAAEYPSLAQMLRAFASRQIRNRATLGGNLATASPIGDSAPVLLTLGASLTLDGADGERTVPLEDFFTGYRRTALRPGEFIREIVVPRSAAGAAGLTRRVAFFKVAKRREVDISTVAAAFALDLDPAGIVRRARLAYGGVAERPQQALRAEAALLDRPLGAAAVEVGRVLATEFQPISDVRGSAAYRRALVVSLWEKFVAGDFGEATAEDHVPARGGRPSPADPSRALTHESGVLHATGAALYAGDIAQRRAMLDVWPVLSPHARARILRCDATRARQASGIAAVLLADDIPGENDVGAVRHDEPLLAAGEVHYHGQIVALVVGESIAVCRAAAAMIEVAYEPLPPVLGLPAAVAPHSWHTEPSMLRRGDCAAALAAAPCRFDGDFHSGGQDHFYLETQAAWAEPIEGGCVHVYASTQHPSEVQTVVGRVLGLSRNKVVTESPRMGGGFGGKESQANTFAALVALAAHRTGRPVRLQLDRDVDMIVTGKRHPFAARFSVGHDHEGRLLAVRVELIADGGWSLDLSQAILDRALLHLDNAYYLPAVEFTGRVAKTNVASNTAFRGFGGPQGMLVIEEIIDRVARRLGLPPELVRERNLYHATGETNTTHYGQEIGDHRLAACWRQVIAQADFFDRRRALAAWNTAHPRVKRGLAVTPVKFGISFTLTHFNQAGALVLLYPDGTAQVNHGGTEMGQGLHTKILGIVMRELGLPAHRIRVMPTSTDRVPNASPTAASAGADLNGAAVAAACATLRARLTPSAARLLAKVEGSVTAAPFADARQQQQLAALSQNLRFADNSIFTADQPGLRVPFADACRRAYLDRVSLAATGFYRTPGLSWDRAAGRGKRFHYFVNGAAVAEVEVDGYTGGHRVLRVDIVEDAGVSLNPSIDRGQIEGGFVQGVGWLTGEELLWDAQGRLLTHGASTYAIPTVGDCPADFRVTFLPDAPQPGVIHGSKAVGEPPLMLALSVREAIRDAVGAFFPDSTQPPSADPANREVRLPSPATAEAVFLAIAGRRGTCLT